MYNKIVSLRRRYVDHFTLTMVLFILLLGMLFYYLKQIENNISLYERYNSRVKQLQIIDQRITHFINHKLKYANYDEVNSEIETLCAILESMQKESQEDRYRKKLEGALTELYQKYQKKKEYVERIKSSNAQQVNAIYYLFDLRKTLLDKGEPSVAMIDAMGESFFVLMKKFAEASVEQGEISRMITKIEKIGVKGKEREVYFFVKTLKRFVKDMSYIDAVIMRSSELDIESSLYTLETILKNDYQQSSAEQKFVASLFFMLSLVFTLFLLYMYVRMKKVNRELRAYQYAVENSDNMILMTDTDYKITYVNDAFEHYMGYSKKEVIGRTPKILSSGLMDREVYRTMYSALKKGKKWDGEFINRKKNGALIYEKASIVPVVHEHQVISFLAIKLDVSEYRIQQTKILQSAAVYENTQEGILIIDKDRLIISCNKAFEKMLQCGEKTLTGERMQRFSSRQHGVQFYDQMWTKILQEEKWTGKVYITRADKVEFPIWLSVNSVKDKRGEVINYIAIYTDLTEVIRTQEKADFLAYHDSLTLLPNRAYYEQYMVKLTDEMMGKSHKTAIMFLDLDRFKVINDTLGHATGDELLKLSAERISKVLSGDTFFARLGGDEFVIILHDVQSREQVKHLVEKILKVVRVPMFVSQHQLTISVSIGISIYPDDSMEANILTKYADSAMYSAKENGKDTYAFYERQLTIDIHSRLNLEQKLSGALKEHEFSLVYHPLYDLTSHRVLGVETLLRWKNSALGAVSPDEFIPVAEDTGLIIEIGYYVLEEACRTFVSWKDKGVALEYISVNISSVQLRQKNFLQKMAKIITKTNILPSEIEIELTESILFEYSGSKINVLQKLSEMGCRISIDDFGTGYSSMSYLKDLPVDTVKIDQTFVRHLVDNEHDQKVVKAIIALSKSLGYKVIAEGIESFEQEIFLKTDHCDYGQGYYFSEPLDSSRLIAFIQERENI